MQFKHFSWEICNIFFCFASDLAGNIHVVMSAARLVNPIRGISEYGWGHTSKYVVGDRTDGRTAIVIIDNHKRPLISLYSATNNKRHFKLFVIFLLSIYFLGGLL